MSITDQIQIHNRLLRCLPADQFGLFSPHLEPIDLPVKHVLVEPYQTTSHVCFLESGLASMTTMSMDNETVEIGHIGREGVTGAHVALMTAQTPNRTFMQIGGAGLTLPVEVLARILMERVEIRRIFLLYVHSCELQLAQTALANARYSVYERLARWLLMVDDRIDGHDLPLTHEFLGLMLGVRRSGVTDQIHLLEGIHAIKATRGNIQIIDRSKLEEIAGGCYGIPEREYERLIGLPIKDRPLQ